MNMPTTSERLVEAMEKTQRLRERQREEATAGLSPAITIAISREAGAGGVETARAVGERLGWPVYDRELLQLVADSMGLRTDLLERVDERRKSWLEECMERLVSVRGASENTYVQHLIEILLSLAAHGQCVIVGRGSPHLLPSASTLRVRMYAPVADRIAAIEKLHSFTHDEAARWVARTDTERARFVQDHFHKDVADLMMYDVLLNSSRFSVPECAELVIASLRQMQLRTPAMAAR